MLDSNVEAVVSNVLANIAYFPVLTPREMLDSNAVAVISNVLANIAYFTVLTPKQMLDSIMSLLLYVMIWPILPTSQF